MLNETSLDPYPIDRFTENLRFLRSIAYVDTCNIIKLSEDAWALTLRESTERDGILLAAFSTQNPLFMFGLRQGAEATQLFVCDSVFIWLDAIEIDDQTAVRCSAYAAFSWFHSNDEAYVRDYLTFRRNVQIENNIYRYVSLSFHPTMQRAAKEHLLC